MLLWLIIIGLVGSAIFNLVVKGAVSGIGNIVEKSRINDLNDDMDRLQEDWNRRVKQLGIDLDSAVRVKYYCDYDYDKDRNTKSYMYVYMWPVEGAIGSISSIHRFDDNGNRVELTRSPLEWEIVYQDLKDIVGVYKRNDVCLIQYDDTSLGYPVEEYEKIKKVYEDAKAMTN